MSVLSIIIKISFVHSAQKDKNLNPFRDVRRVNSRLTEIVWTKLFCVRREKSLAFFDERCGICLNGPILTIWSLWGPVDQCEVSGGPHGHLALTTRAPAKCPRGGWWAHFFDATLAWTLLVQPLHKIHLNPSQDSHRLPSADGVGPVFWWNTSWKWGNTRGLHWKKKWKWIKI